MKNWWTNLWQEICAEGWFGPIPIATVIAIVLILVLWALSGWYGGDRGEIFRGIYIEAGGAVLDIGVFGIILVVLAAMTSRRREITRQMELIDDYKKWDSDEARYRIAGAIRRLKRLNCTAIDFSGIEIRNFCFRWLEIESIAGSTFYDGRWGTWSGKDQVILTDVNFRGVDCRDVVFSESNPLAGLDLPVHFATFTDCNFQSAQLQDAVFRGACLKWSETPPEEVGKWVDIGDGHAALDQTYYPPFDGADLKGASFEDVVFRNVDFRAAVNIEHCTFTGASGLTECLFDNEEVKEKILRKASGSSTQT